MRLSSRVLCGVSVAVLALGAMAGPAPMGLVLSGGGAKGAYEVGVWQALCECALASNVTVISGTSVGAINAAVFATRPDSAESLWKGNMSDVFTLNTNSVGRSLQKIMDIISESLQVAQDTGDDMKGYEHLASKSLTSLASNAVEMTETDSRREGYVDSSRLAALLDANLPVVWPAEAPSVYVTSVEKGASGGRAVWRLNDESHERRVRMILASAALPFGFDTVDIDGKTYVDGGWEAKGGSNVPIEPILENHPDVKTVVVVYLRCSKRIPPEQRDRVKSAAEKSGVNVIEIVPSENIDGWFPFQGVFDASPETAQRLIKLGKKDAQKAISLDGRIPSGI